MFNKTDEILNGVDKLLNKKFTNSLNFYLDQFHEIILQEKEVINSSTKKAIEEIRDTSDKLIKIDELARSNAKLSEKIQQLVQEIRKRDAIIERKNNQIAKLKRTQNEI